MTSEPSSNLTTARRCRSSSNAPAGPWRRLPALPAFWVGLIYDDDALQAAWDLVKSWTAEQRQTLRDEVPRLGFAATIGGRKVLDVARDCLEIARRGLARRDQVDQNGCDETRYLDQIDELAERGITPAEELLEKFHGAWERSVEPVFTEYAY